MENNVFELHYCEKCKKEKTKEQLRQKLEEAKIKKEQIYCFHNYIKMIRDNLI